MCLTSPPFEAGGAPTDTSLNGTHSHLIPKGRPEVSFSSAVPRDELSSTLRLLTHNGLTDYLNNKLFCATPACKRIPAGGAHLIRFQTTEPIPFYRKHSPKNSAWSRQHTIDRLAPIESLHEMDKAHTHILFLTCAPPAERLTVAFHLRRNHLPLHPQGTLRTSTIRCLRFCIASSRPYLNQRPSVRCKRLLGAYVCA